MVFKEGVGTLFQGGHKKLDAVILESVTGHLWLSAMTSLRGSQIDCHSHNRVLGWNAQEQLSKRIVKLVSGHILLLSISDEEFFQAAACSGLYVYHWRQKCKEPQGCKPNYLYAPNWRDEQDGWFYYPSHLNTVRKRVHEPIGLLSVSNAPPLACCYWPGSLKRNLMPCSQAMLPSLAFSLQHLLMSALKGQFMRFQGHIPYKLGPLSIGFMNILRGAPSISQIIKAMMMPPQISSVLSWTCSGRCPSLKSRKSLQPDLPAWARRASQMTRTGPAMETTKKGNSLVCSNHHIYHWVIWSNKTLLFLSGFT